MDNTPNIAYGIGAVALALTTLVSVILLVAAIFYILTVQKALNKCAPENRTPQPALTWLLLVPCVNIVFHFFVVLGLAKSLGAEFQKRGIAEEPEPGKMLGLITCILMCCSLIPYLGILCFLAGLVCWILYWIKIAGYSSKLNA